MNGFDAIVVGAGYGGVTCAALLSHRGLRVALVDKNDRPGGKAMTIRQDGCAYELWPIAGGPAAPSRFHEVLSLVGLGDQVELLAPEQAGSFRYVRSDGTRATIPFSAQPASDPAAAARLPDLMGATQEETANMIGVAAAVFTLSDEEIEALDGVDARSWIQGFGIGPVLESYFMTLFNLLFVVAVDRLPASEAVRTLRDFFQGGGGRYHARGFAHPAEALVEYVVRQGGEFFPKSRVDKVVLEEGRAVGVQIGGDELRAPVVISNAGIQPTVLKLVGPSAFPADYVERVRSFEPSWAFVGARYIVDAPIFTDPMVVQFSDESWWDTARFKKASRGVWPAEPLLFVTVPSLYDPSLAPDSDHQVALAGTLGSPDPDSTMNAVAVDQVHDAMLRTWPELEGHVVRREPFTARHVAAASRDAVVPGQGGECIGLGQVFGQCGRDKPDVRSPIPGLYYVGCDAGGYGCGTHQAVESGFVVADVVASDLALV